MKHNRVFIALCMVIVAIMGSSCSISQAIRLKDCEYGYSHVSDMTIMNMTMSELKSLKGASTLTQILLGKSDLNIGCTVHVNVYNPNKKVASVEQVFYSLMVDDVVVAEGSSQRLFVVPAKSSNELSLKLTADVRKLVKPQSREVLFKLAKNFLRLGKEPSRITLVLKPVIRMGKSSAVMSKQIPLKFELNSSLTPVRK